MTQAVLLHTIQDAEHYLQNDLFGDAKLFSANVNVVYYLKYQHNRECGDICAYLTPLDADYISKAALQASYELLRELDQLVAPVLNKELGLSIRYFAPLYSYIGSRQLALYELLALALKRMFEDCQVDSVVLYEGYLGPLKSPVMDFFTAIFADIKHYVISYEKPSNVRKTIVSGVGVEQIANLLLLEDSAFLAFKEAVTGQQGKSTENVLLFEACLKNAGQILNKDMNIYYFQQSPNVLKNLFNYELDLEFFPSQDKVDAVRTSHLLSLTLLYRAVKIDFCREFVQYLQVCSLYWSLNEVVPIKQVFWETPPVQGSGSLLLEYLMTNQQAIVIGIQAEATCFVGKVDALYATTAVFNRCHKFITQSELSGKICISNTKPVLKVNQRQPIDVAFYLKPTLSFLQTGQFASHSNVQEYLLKFLEQQQSESIHVVTHSLSDFSNCAMLSLLKQMTNIKWIYDMHLGNYLTKYAPKLIIIDSIMPLIRDIIEEKETQLVIIHDLLIQLDNEVLMLLKERAYYAESVNDGNRMLQLYFDGNLKIKT